MAFARNQRNVLCNILTATLAIVTQGPLEVFDDDTDDDSDEDDEDRQHREKIMNYAEETVPRQTNRQFREHFRMSPTTFELLIEKISDIILHGDFGNAPPIPTIPAEKQMLICIWVVGNKESFRSVGDRFGVAKSTAWRCCKRVCSSILCMNQQQHIISWPTSCAGKNRKKQGFAANFPGALAAIDVCAIAIPAPTENRNSYFNRKGFASVSLQGICDADMLFLDCYAGEAGSVHDATVWKNCHFFKKVQRRQITFNPDEHIIGDLAYPVAPFLMVPYKDNGRLTAAQQHFNTKLSAARSVIERSFALLRGRFRRLKYLDMYDLKWVPTAIIACCVLHNVCILEDDIDYIELDFDSDDEQSSDDDDDNIRNRGRQTALGQAKRTVLTNRLRRHR